jgi:flagellar hook assembly protein FlgD
MELNLLHLFEITPKRVNLSQNYPNPFNPLTAIDVIMKENSQGSLIIYNINGQEVQTLHKGEFSSGITQFLWNGRDNLGRPVSGGTYIYRLMVDGSAGQSQKMILLK